MEKQTDRALSLWMEDAFRDKMFLRKLGINRADLSQLFDQVNWRSQLSSLVPIRRRISCAEALKAFRPLLDALAPEPEEGWLRNAYQGAGLNQEDAGTLVSVTLIFLSALLTGLGWFDNIAKHAGAGTLVPITGFANAMVAPALEFKSEGLVLGTGARLFTVAGPVLVYGISASVIYGVVLWIVSLF